MSGLPDIDVQDWKANTLYSGYSDTSEQIQVSKLCTGAVLHGKIKDVNASSVVAILYLLFIQFWFKSGMAISRLAMFNL